MAAVNSGYSRVPQIMHMLRCLFFIRAHFGIKLRAVHVPGKDNELADAISRNNLHLFYLTDPAGNQGESGSASSASISDSGNTAGLDIGGLVPVVQDLFSSGLASTTQQVYRCGSRRFQKFCSLHNLRPYPAGESMLTSFIAWLYQTGVTAGTIKSYLSAAVRYTQISLGHGDPHAASMPQLEYVVKWVKRKTAAQGSRPRLPITGQILTSLIGVWENEPDQFNGSMLWAVACIRILACGRDSSSVRQTVRQHSPFDCGRRIG